MKNFVSDQRGAITILFSIMAVVIFIIAGVAIEYAGSVKTKSQLQNALDSSALAVATSMKQGKTWDDAKIIGESYFAANTQKMRNAVIKFSKAKGANGEIVKASGTADWPGGFTRLINGSDAVGVSGKTVVDIGSASVELIFIADVSYSMGIGADETDVKLLNASIGCAFACHEGDMLERARASGATLRVDVIKNAIIKSIKQIDDSGNSIPIGLVTFSSSVVTAVKPTTDYVKLKSQAAKIDLPLPFNQGGTNYFAAVDKAQEMIQARKKSNGFPNTQYAIIILTDGVQSTRVLGKNAVGRYLNPDVPINDPNWRTDPTSYFMTMPMDLCDGLKAEGASIFILNTEYVTENVGAGSDIVERQLKPVMPERFNACASKPGYVYSANDSDSIYKATDTLVKLVKSMATRLVM